MFTNNFDPVAISIFTIDIRWYSLSYIFGVLFGWLYCIKFLIKDKNIINIFNDLITYIIFGIIVGGRLGYVFIYNLKYYLNNMHEVFFIWEGGMSFHGGLVGIIVTTYFFSKKHGINKYIFLDYISITAPIGIFFGRVSNFINGELVGKSTNSDWGVIFLSYDEIPRHPSQLYEAFFEGIILFTLMNLIYFRKNYEVGKCSYMFLIFYGIFRVASEFFREPDAQIGYIFGFITIGMLLSFLMIFIGTILYFRKNVS